MEKRKISVDVTAVYLTAGSTRHQIAIRSARPVFITTRARMKHSLRNIVIEFNIVKTENYWLIPETTTTSRDHY